MKITLYTTGCPMCKVLKSKLDSSGLDYDVIDDLDKMIELGFQSAPILDVDGTIMTFQEAVKWVNEQGGNN